MLAVVQLDNSAILSACGAVAGVIGTLWRLHVAALQDRIAGLAAELAEARAEQAKCRDAVITALQAGAELRGRIGALENEVQHARDTD